MLAVLVGLDLLSGQFELASLLPKHEVQAWMRKDGVPTGKVRQLCIDIQLYSCYKIDMPPKAGAIVSVLWLLSSLSLLYSMHRL